jgi:hypothetical protein
VAGFSVLYVYLFPAQLAHAALCHQPGLEPLKVLADGMLDFVNPSIVKIKNVTSKQLERLRTRMAAQAHIQPAARGSAMIRAWATLPTHAATC